MESGGKRISLTKEEMKLVKAAARLDIRGRELGVRHVSVFGTAWKPSIPLY